MSLSQPFSYAKRTKGLLPALRRLITIGQRYGVTPKKMSQVISDMVDIVGRYGLHPTLPMTGNVLARQPDISRAMQQAGVELAVHGWTHISYNDVSPEMIRGELERARSAFAALDIPLLGFRSPYLSDPKILGPLLRETNFKYVSNQTIYWPVVEIPAQASTSANWMSYQLALTVYHPWSPDEYVSTPRLVDGLIEIPVSLPDDEMLADRLEFDSQSITKAWQMVLEQSYRYEGLFVLQLHPERAHVCAAALSAMLSTATGLEPRVWGATLAEIAEWWRAKIETTVSIQAVSGDTWKLKADGPPGLSWLARGVTLAKSDATWDNNYQVCLTPELVVQTEQRPFVGLMPGTSSALRTFLQHQGYLIEESDTPELYGVYLPYTNFDARSEQSVLREIEDAGQPLVRLGRWPFGARSALAITGDIDALTIWDYVWRLFGH